MLRNWPAHSRFTAIILGSAIFLGAVESALLIAAERAVSPESTLAYGVCLAVVFAYWLEHDTRKTGIMQVWDQAWFFAIAWPVVIPYYLVRTRGFRKGLKILLAWLGFFVGVTFVTALLGSWFGTQG